MFFSKKRWFLIYFAKKHLLCEKSSSQIKRNLKSVLIKYILIKDVVYNNKRAFECTYHAGLAGFIKSYVDRNGNVLKKEQIK